jgi:hypothetical protein
MFNSKPIKNFEISIENIIERFGNSEEPYSVYIDICNDALRVSMGNYSVISSIAITTALLAEKIKPEKVFVNQQLFFKSNLLNTVNSCAEWGSKDLMIQYLFERGCSKCKTFDRKCFPVANFLDKDMLVPQLNWDFGYCNAQVLYMSNRIYEREFAKHPELPRNT